MHISNEIVEFVVITRELAAKSKVSYRVLKRGSEIEWENLWRITYNGPSSGPEEVFSFLSFIRQMF
jgi:hypothetical protein